MCDYSNLRCLHMAACVVGWVEEDLQKKKERRSDDPEFTKRLQLGSMSNQGTLIVFW